MSTAGWLTRAVNQSDQEEARVLDTLVVLIAERLALGADVAAAKFVSGGEIDDPVREKEILDRVASELEAGGTGPDGVAFFGDQIVANKVIQRGLLSHWRVNPADFPGRRRGLADEIRPQLDVINKRMLALLPAVAHLPPGRRARAVALLDARLATSLPLRQHRDLRRAAARVAVRSLRAPATCGRR